LMLNLCAAKLNGDGGERAYWAKIVEPANGRCSTRRLDSSARVRWWLRLATAITLPAAR
jgi:hypothetical protein